MFSLSSSIKNVGYGLACVCTVSLLASCSKEAPSAQRPAPAVEVLTIAPQTLPADKSFVAQTESSQRVEITARVSGFLDAIHYTEGSAVKKGELMFTIDPKPFQAQLEAMQGQLKMQQARLGTAEANFNRIKPLAKLNAVSQSDLDNATGELNGSRAAVYAAEAAVEEARLNLGYTRIYAPLDGQASQAMQRQGAYINAMSSDSKLTYIAALDPIWVNFSVSQNQEEHLRKMIAEKKIVMPTESKLEVELTLPGGQVYPHRGQIDFSDPSYEQATGTMLIRAVIPNPDKALRPGMFVTAQVIGGFRPDAIVVPQLAVMQGA
ncbi:MAG TPA: efflux RND transporter periplasmic adaptor subunit, partial [bacterium]|nr:efflux RND transporter periplasmic adaptor subunit [bacterium]